MEVRINKPIIVLLGTIAVLALVLLAGCANSTKPGSTESITKINSTENATKNSSMSEQEYKAACQEIPARDLTDNPRQYVDQKIKCTGEVAVFWTGADEKTGKEVTKLVVSVQDGQGVLPVYVYYTGSTDAFVKDKVTVFGDFFGKDVYKDQQIQEKSLPRIDARYIVVER